MSAVRIALLGIGSLRCGAPILASLATFFGERPLEIRMYDSDPERLEVFDRLARVYFLMTRAPHGLLSTESPEEALEDVEFVVLSLSENCAVKLLKSRGIQAYDDPIKTAVDAFELEKYSLASVLSLQKEPIGLGCYYRLAWPAEISEQERAALPHQILRWLNEEEYPYELLKTCETSPLKAWLENPTTAEYVR